MFTDDIIKSMLGRVTHIIRDIKWVRRKSFLLVHQMWIKNRTNMNAKESRNVNFDQETCVSTQFLELKFTD